MPSKTKSLEYAVQANARPQSYVGYKAILMEIMEDLNGNDTTSLFAGVYAVYETEPEGYPVCYVVEKTGEGQILDTHRNQREWQFSLVIHQGIGNKAPEEAYTALLDATDRVIQALDENPMLKDSHGQDRCMFARVVPVTFEYASEESPVHRALLTVAIVDVVNRYLPA